MNVGKLDIVVIGQLAVLSGAMSSRVMEHMMPQVDQEDHSTYITTTSGMSGYFAVQVWWNPDPGFWEPYQTGVGRYSKIGQAISEAMQWAEAEGMKYKP